MRVLPRLRLDVCLLLEMGLRRRLLLPIEGPCSCWANGGWVSAGACCSRSSAHCSTPSGGTRIGDWDSRSPDHQAVQARGISMPLVGRSWAKLSRKSTARCEEPKHRDPSGREGSVERFGPGSSLSATASTRWPSSKRWSRRTALDRDSLTTTLHHLCFRKMVVRQTLACRCTHCRKHIFYALHTMGGKHTPRTAINPRVRPRAKPRK